MNGVLITICNPHSSFIVILQCLGDFPHCSKNWRLYITSNGPASYYTQIGTLINWLIYQLFFLFLHFIYRGLHKVCFVYLKLKHSKNLFMFCVSLKINCMWYINIVLCVSYTLSHTLKLFIISNLWHLQWPTC